MPLDELTDEAPWTFLLDGPEGRFTSRAYDCLTCCVKAALGYLGTAGSEQFTVVNAAGKISLGNVVTMTDYARDAYRRHNSAMLGTQHG